MDNDRVRLYEFIFDHYSLGELKDLCFYLGVVYDDLDGSGRKDKARELMEYLARRGRLDDLRAVLGQQRAEQYAATGQRPALRLPPESPAATGQRPGLRPAARDPRQIFISHAMADAAFAQRLAADLQRRGYRVWIAPQSIHPGEQWVAAINRGLEESGVMVVLLTPAAAASPWVQMETNVAIELERAGEMVFVPLLRERGRYPGLWRAYQWVMADGEYAGALAGLRARLEDPPPNPLPGAEGSRRPLSNPLPGGEGTRRHAQTGIELIRIPAGPFLYGSSDADTMARDNERPQRTVELPEYWIGRAPVTNAQYKRFLDANPGQRVPVGWEPYRWDEQRRAPPAAEAKHPVVLVSWEDAKAFCDWAGLALPTEEQWEKAARGTDGRVWPWGNEPPTAGHCNFGMTVGGTTPVAQYSPQGDSPYGCVDMTGNVWEWTASWYRERRTRVLRGGSWGDDVQVTRAAYQGSNMPRSRLNNVGFRVVELLSDPGV